MALVNARNTNTALLPVALVRYRFVGEAKVDLHFHEVDGRSLFFFPAELPHREGQWIFVEFEGPGLDVPSLARGRVWTPQNVRLIGSWLEFPTPDLPLIIKNQVQTRRAHERLPVDVTAAVRCRDGARLVCRISDVSEDGLRLSGLPFFLNVGETISIELVGLPRANSDLGKGRVVWIRPQQAGIHFASSGNPSLMKLVEHAAAVRSTAVEVTHPGSCNCLDGKRPIEPPLASASVLLTK